MSNQQKIWDSLLSCTTTTTSDIIKKTRANRGVAIQYLHALSLAGYIEATAEKSKRGQPIETVCLIKKSGEIAPRFNNGLVIDANTKEEFIVSEKNTKDKSRAKLLIPILEAILALEKQEIVVSEISHKLKEELSAGHVYPSSALNKWLYRLEGKKLIADTAARERNSRVYLIDRAGVAKLLEEIRKSKAYWLHI